MTSGRRERNSGPAPARAFRAGTATAVTLATSVAGHLLGHGVPTAPGIALAAVPVVVAAWLLSARERTWTTITAMAFGGQLIAHELLSALGGRTAATMVAPGIPAVGMACLSMPMMLGHALAAVVAGWWLRRGEQRIWAAFRRIAAAAKRLLDHGFRRSATPVVRWVPRLRPDDRCQFGCLRYAIILRGPPAIV